MLEMPVTLADCTSEADLEAWSLNEMVHEQISLLWRAEHYQSPPTFEISSKQQIEVLSVANNPRLQAHHQGTRASHYPLSG